MEHFRYFTQGACDRFKSPRYHLEHADAQIIEEPATSFKDCITICENLAALQQSAAKYVIIGIPEDIGVRANMGRPGAHEAWSAFLTQFLNLQHHPLNDVHRFCILGAVETTDLMRDTALLDATKHHDRVLLSRAVQELDKRICKILSAVLATNKIPIVIGGGHNNCYPLLKSFGQSAPIDCINIDAHTDLRAAIGRHSGNGFTHALKNGYLHNYYMLGIQEPYLSEAMFHTINTHQNIVYHPYVPGNFNPEELVQHVFKCVDVKNFGLEIDMDVVANFPSSAQSPAGYSFEQLRILVQTICKQAANSPRYIHVCEAAPRYGTPHETGKALALLVNDFR